MSGTILSTGVLNNTIDETFADPQVHHLGLVEPVQHAQLGELGLIRNAGIEPRVIEYLKTPPSRAELLSLLERMGLRPRQLLRCKGAPYDQLGLDDPSLSDDQLLDAMLAHPLLIERPIVVTPLGVGLCRPSEAVLALLPHQADSGTALAQVSVVWAIVGQPSPQAPQLSGSVRTLASQPFPSSPSQSA